MTDPKTKAVRLFKVTYALGTLSLIGFVIYLAVNKSEHALRIGGAWFFGTIFLMGLSRKIQQKWLNEAEEQRKNAKK